MEEICFIQASAEALCIIVLVGRAKKPFFESRPVFHTSLQLITKKSNVSKAVKSIFALRKRIKRVTKTTIVEIES